jgi:hypothetical protein
MMNDFYSMPPAIMKAADRAIDEMDWTKVHKVMEFLNWEWASTKDVPEIWDLRHQARHLCAHCYYECKEDEDEYHTGTGGIHVDYFKKDQWFTISFVVERGETNDFSEQPPF